MASIRSYPPGALGAFLKEARRRHTEAEDKQKLLFHDMFHAAISVMNPEAKKIYDKRMKG